RWANKKAAVKITAAKGVLREALREVCLPQHQRIKLVYGYDDFAYCFTACQTIVSLISRQDHRHSRKFHHLLYSL
ncbi:hypothetical protein, partial [Alteromonas australica]|uniref:hypothetical protein n=1 Tax=Alteromonas australica TaxID=589873 RepID=UPI00235692CB